MSDSESNAWLPYFILFVAMLPNNLICILSSGMFRHIKKRFHALKMIKNIILRLLILN